MIKEYLDNEYYTYVLAYALIFPLIINFGDFPEQSTIELLMFSINLQRKYYQNTINPINKASNVGMRKAEGSFKLFLDKNI